MPKLHVVTQAVIDQFEAQQMSLTSLLCPNSIATTLAARDVAASKLAFHYFPFSFDKESTLVPCFSLLNGMDDEASPHHRFRERVLEQYASQHLAETHALGETQSRCDRYRVFPLNDVDWVISVQRHICEVDNPEQEALRHNAVFFDELMMYASTTVPFHQLCQTNVFAQYLATLPHAG